MDEPLTLSVAEAAKRLGIGSTLCRDLVARKELPVVRLGRRVLINAGALARMIDERTEISAGSFGVLLSSPSRPVPGRQGAGR